MSFSVFIYVSYSYILTKSNNRPFRNTNLLHAHCFTLRIANMALIVNMATITSFKTNIMVLSETTPRKLPVLQRIEVSEIHLELLIQTILNLHPQTRYAHSAITAAMVIYVPWRPNAIFWKKGGVSSEGVSSIRLIFVCSTSHVTAIAGMHKDLSIV